MLPDYKNPCNATLFLKNSQATTVNPNTNTKIRISALIEMDFERQIFLRMANISLDLPQHNPKRERRWIGRTLRKPIRTRTQGGRGQEQVSWSGLNPREPPTIWRIDTKQP